MPANITISKVMSLVLQRKPHFSVANQVAIK